ncbi:MAG: heat-shock protein Hsp20 [Desulfurococcales archaeon ex4484_204]|nr:MAG: heat-shock protein Hsp20 [Desulfurococcales archaeon ex4484_204]
MDRRKRRTIFDIFNELFREIEGEFQEFVREAERLRRYGGEEIGELREFRRPFVYGFRITIGPDGLPKIEEFGNVRRREGPKPIISEEREPLVDVLDEGNKVRIIAEMPGVEKDNIQIKASNGKLIIRASNHNRRYYKEVNLPAEVDIKTAKASYRNGVLEVTITKSRKEGSEFEIKVE